MPPSPAEEYITESSSKDYRDLEGAVGSTVTSAHEPIAEQEDSVRIGNEGLHEFASKTSAFRKVQVYKAENHTLSSSVLELQVPNPPPGTGCDRSNCFRNKVALNSLKSDERRDRDADWSLEQLKKAKFNSHLSLDMSSLKEHNEMSIIHLEPWKNSFYSISPPLREHNASHLIKPTEFNAPTTSYGGVSSTQRANSYAEQNIILRPTNASHFSKTVSSDRQNNQFYKECTPVARQRDQWTSQQYTKHSAESDPSLMKDFSLPKEQGGSYFESQLTRSSNICVKEVPMLDQLSQGSADESGRAEECHAVQLLLKTMDTEDATPAVPNKVTELKSQSTQTSDENMSNNNSSPRSPESGDGMLHCASGDEPPSKANSFRISFRQKYRKSLDNNNDHSSKDSSGYTEHGLYKPQTSRLENDSLSLSNSAGYLSLKRKRLMSYAIDKEKEIITKCQDKTTTEGEYLLKQGEKNHSFEETGNDVIARKTVCVNSADSQLDIEGMAKKSEENEIQVIYESEQLLNAEQHSKDNVSSSSPGLHEDNSHVVSSSNEKNVHSQRTEDLTNTGGARRMTEDEKREQPVRRLTSSMPSLTNVNSAGTLNTSINTSVVPKGAVSSDLTSINTSVVPKEAVSSDLTSINTSVVPKEAVSSGLTSFNTDVVLKGAVSLGLTSINTGVVLKGATLSGPTSINTSVVPKGAVSSGLTLINTSVVPKGAVSSGLTSINTGVVPKGVVLSGLTSINTSVVPKGAVSSGLTSINTGVVPKGATLSGLSGVTQSYETLNKNDNQNDYSLAMEKRHPFRNLTEEMQTRKKELIILDQLAKEREKEYKELLQTRKEKHRLLDMLEKCFPKLIDSPKMEDDEKQPFKPETLNAETIPMNTNCKFEINANFKTDQPIAETKPSVFNLKEASALAENDVFSTGESSEKTHALSGNPCRDSEKTGLLSGNQETDPVSGNQETDPVSGNQETDPKTTSNVSKLSGPVWKSESKPSHCHTIPTAAVNPVRPQPAPLIQTYSSVSSSPQLVPPLYRSKEATGATQHDDKFDQTPEKQNPKSVVENKTFSPSVATVAPVMNNLCQPSDVCEDKPSYPPNIHLRTLYNSHLSSVTNSFPSLQKLHNCVREHKNDHCEVCERITGCSAPNPNSNVCFTRDIVQKQGGFLPQERMNELRSSQNKKTAFYTVRPNVFSHPTLVNPLVVPSLSGYSGTSEPRHSFRHDNPIQVRASSDASHRLYNPNFTTSIKNFASQVPFSYRPETAMINCTLPDLSSQTLFRPLMNSTHSRMEVRPIIQQQPHQVVQQRGNDSRTMNPQTFSTGAPLYDTWTQRPMMLNYPSPQSMVHLPSDHFRDTQAMGKNRNFSSKDVASNQKARPRCGLCGKKAIFMCSGCKQSWYCGESCQVKHWPNHSKFCRK
ncbi:uncharacterized protein LOC111088273 isoform X1 [Limulus polyphemus]|uniref:Uncharacterized protein LOC111088273 isoform X1 n=1 Tax=Limulus polyphemus TaxID=6850 RepID=A0ABM1TCK2_LIMPO|nr:uncharacterized protein LOC111088273 isoform X1 [Limulus polyphemus]